MEIQDKALYNLLRINWQEDPTIKVKPWQVEDYRRLTQEALFLRLNELGVSLAVDSFLTFAESCENPEELTNCLWLQEDDEEGYDRVYLLLFELWRRLLPEKQSLSIFCDELDYRIDLYDQNLLEEDELVQSSLKELEDILDQNTERGEDPQEVFATIAGFCAHDLESFLYDYISAQVDLGNEVLASELVDGFYSYIKKVYWFDFLKLKLLIAAGEEEGDHLLRGLLEQLEEEPDLELFSEIAHFLTKCNDRVLFFQVIAKAAELLQTEGDFQEILKIVTEYFRLTDQDDQYALFQNMCRQRENLPKDKPLSASDGDLLVFKKYFNRSLI